MINYGRRQALKDKAILPMKYYPYDCKAEWVDKKGEAVSVETLGQHFRYSGGVTLLGEHDDEVICEAHQERWAV